MTTERRLATYLVDGDCSPNALSIGVSACARDWATSLRRADRAGAVPAAAEFGLEDRLPPRVVPPDRPDGWFRGLALHLRALLTAAVFTPAPAADVGAALVDAHFTGAEVLPATAAVLDRHLTGLTGRDDAAMRTRLVLALGALAGGFAEALHRRVQAEHRHAFARLRHQAHHDPLTGLPNRALLADRISQVFRLPADATRVGLCFLDLDGFKRVNDSYGHQVGDRLLAAVADRMSACVAEHGQLLARTGGDEFVILVVHERAGAAAAIADQVVRALAAPFQVDGHELRVSASIGVVERPLAATAPAELFEAADLTMYRAKNAGKGRWALFDQDRGTGRPDRVRHEMGCLGHDAAALR